MVEVGDLERGLEGELVGEVIYARHEPSARLRACGFTSIGKTPAVAIVLM